MLLQPITINPLVILTGGLILAFGAQFGLCLHCVHMKSRSLSISQNCFPGEVCAKHVFFTNVTGGTPFIEERVERKCSKYNPEKGDMLDGCRVRNANPPLSVLRCLCNETNFCNAGSPFFKSNLPLHFFIVVLVAIVALNKYVMLRV